MRASIDQSSKTAPQSARPPTRTIMTTEILITASLAARILNCSTQNIAYLRERGTLVPAKSGPFRFHMADIEAHRLRRETRTKHGPKHGVEFVSVSQEQKKV